LRAGTLLMPAQNLAGLPVRRVFADVAGSQPTTDGSLDCYIGNFSAMLYEGRTQATYFLKRGLSGAMPSAVQEYWSRGCRKAQLSYLVFVCWRLLPPAQRKKRPSFQQPSRLRPSLPTLANISDLIPNTAPMAPRHGGMGEKNHQNQLSAGYCPMLKPAAVPIIQDRRLC
jgi:hypothetical protein